LDTAIQVDAYFGDTEKKESFVSGCCDENKSAEMWEIESSCRETTGTSGARLDSGHISIG